MILDPRATLLLSAMPSLMVCSAAAATLDSPTSVSHGAPSGATEASFAAGDTLSPADRATIQAAIEADRHAIRSVAGALRAHNPGQGWSAQFDDDGALVTPGGDSWSWGLSLVSYGYKGVAGDVYKPEAVRSDANRAIFDWGPSLSEWWINDSRGLEHGFTLHSRPASAPTRPGAELEFTLDVRGALVPHVDEDRLGARFTGQEGRVVLTYTGLLAFDADGQFLPATLGTQRAGAGHQLVIHVKDEGARYPITIDPVTQSTYLKASNTEEFDFFGWSVAMSGDTAVIGSTGESSGASGVNGDQTDNSQSDSGAAYVFVRSGSNWAQQAYLKASNVDADDGFGFTVAIDGDTIVVGAIYESGGSGGVNGDQSDNSMSNAGAAYVFVRNGTTWSQQAYLKAANPGIVDYFGNSVSISGDRIAVGAPREDGGTTGIDGDQTDNSLSGAGAVYIFERSGVTWAQTAYIKPLVAGDSDLFGFTVSLDGDTLAAGAPYEKSVARGVNGDANDDSGTNEGAAYVLKYNGATWVQEAYMKSSLPAANESYFGYSVAVEGDTLAVGAPGDLHNAEEVGAAYVFGRAGSTWTSDHRLLATHPGHEDQFGWFVALSGSTIAVCANTEGSNATGIDGDATDNSAASSGAVYPFVKVGTQWLQQAYVKASNAEADDFFGWAVAISGGTLLTTAWREGSSATGVNGDPSNNSASGAGAAYAFELVAPGTLGTNFCRPNVLNSSMSRALITATGSDVASANNLTLTVNGLPTAGTTALLVASKTPTATLVNPGAASSGSLCIASPRMGRDVANMYTGTAGMFSRTIDLTSIAFPNATGGFSTPALAGDTWYWQCWYRDGAGGGSQFSDAIGVTFQ